MTDGKNASERKPYEAPSIKFEKRIEAFASACTCEMTQKTGAGTTAFMVSDDGIKCGPDNFS